MGTGSFLSTLSDGWEGLQVGSDSEGFEGTLSLGSPGTTLVTGQRNKSLVLQLFFLVSTFFFF